MSALRSSRSHGRGVKELFSTSGFRCLLLQYSTTISTGGDATIEAPFMVDYLMNSLGFSKEEAISASTKVSHLKSTKNADLVLSVFRKYGLDKTQIRNIVSSVPKVLLRKADKTLEPKLRVFHEIGLSGSDLVKLITRDSYFFLRGLDTCFTPTIKFLREVLGSNEDLVMAINKSGLLFSWTASKRMPMNVLLLQRYGLSNELIGKWIIRNPRWLVHNPEKLKDILHRVEVELGIPRDSKMFFHGIVALNSLSRSNRQMKLAVFRSFGWSDSDLSTLARTYPFCCSISEAKIRKMLKFYINELGYTPALLASCPPLLTCSLENRVKPRNEVLKILKEKKLECKVSLATVVTYPEKKFEKFMLRYKDEIPDLCEIYTSSQRNKSKTK